jgi:hypothetical protein
MPNMRGVIWTFSLKKKQRACIIGHLFSKFIAIRQIDHAKNTSQRLVAEKKTKAMINLFAGLKSYDYRLTESWLVGTNDSVVVLAGWN